MTRLDVLKKAYFMACHNLMCYSSNAGMSKPIHGFEVEWKDTHSEVALLENMIREIEGQERVEEELLQEDFFTKVINERKRQQELWGEQHYDFRVWMSILGEEFGEACNCSNEFEKGCSGLDKLENEIIQVAALTKVIYENIQEIYRIEAAQTKS